MKILFLNVWNAELREPLRNYLLEEAKDTDVFCLQECFQNMQGLAEEIFGDFQSVHARKEIDSEHAFSQSTYVRKGVVQSDSWTQFDGVVGVGFALWTRIQDGDRAIHICNYHGHALPGEKQDTPERLLASQELASATHHGDATVVGGDFNLDVHTDSVKHFEQVGYQNLIADYGIDTTRNRYVWDLYPVRMYYSDYVFVRGDSPKNFTVPKNEVSDHLPLVLNF